MTTAILTAALIVAAIIIFYAGVYLGGYAVAHKVTSAIEGALDESELSAKGKMEFLKKVAEAIKP
jgi:hypothetical protein